MPAFRLFIALPVSDSVREHLSDIQLAAKHTLPSNVVRWVQPANFHLTLFFLGSTPVEQIDPLASKLGAIAQAHAPFDLSLDHIGYFPNRRRPNVIWVGIKRPCKALMTLQREIASQMPIVDRHGFTPHLTLGYVRKGKQLPADHTLNTIKPTPLSFTTHHFELMRSQSGSHGPVYSSLLTFSLAGIT